jgi:invasion protein IalB
VTLVLWARIATVSAQEAPQIERFADWEVVCSPPQSSSASVSAPPKVDCRAVQRLTVQDSDETVFAVTVIRSNQEAVVAIVSIPLGGYIVPGIELSVDGKKPYKLLVETCNASGCHAGFRCRAASTRIFARASIASLRPCRRLAMKHPHCGAHLLMGQ